MDSIIPSQMAPHFQATKSARLLTVTNVDDAGSGWLLLRLLGDWMRQCAKLGSGENSGVAVVVFSLYREFEFYSSGLSQLGIDLGRHEDMGHFKFIDGVYAKLLGENPSLTLSAALELISDEVEQLKKNHPRVVFLLDSPELAMTLVNGNPHAADAEWLKMFQGVTRQFHHTIIAMSLDSPKMGRSLQEFGQARARVSGVKSFGYEADMSMVLRHYETQNSKTDGTVRISYSSQFGASSSNGIADETFGYQISADGRTVTINGSSA